VSLRGRGRSGLVVGGPSSGVFDALGCFPLPHDLTESERPPPPANQPDEVQSHVRDGEHQEQDQTAGHTSSTQRGPNRMRDADRPCDLVSALLEPRGVPGLGCDGGHCQCPPADTIDEHSSTVQTAQPS
jgi:hypothetical protein